MKTRRFCLPLLLLLGCTAALWPLRIAISGQQSTPGGAIEIAWLLGREETLRRLDEGLRRLENA